MWYSSILRRFLQMLRQERRLAIFEACLIGLVSALAAVLLKAGVGWLGGWRVQKSLLLPAWFLLPSVGLACGFLAGWLVERVAPETSGSGIPQVKAALARIPIALDLRVALIKLIGGILVLGSGLALGREGPTVQVGASLASQLSRWFPTSPEHRRQLIAAGAGAGLAAAFNAPIAGVLFVVEELLQDVSDLTLGTAILASFIGAVVSRFLGGRSLDINLGLTAPTSFLIQDIPFYVILGVLAGLLGALFNRGILSSMTFYKHTLRLGLPARVGLAGLVSGLIVALLPLSFRDNTGLRDMIMTGEVSWSVAAIAFLSQFVLTLVAYGSGAPGGLFAPALTLGAALGSLVGICSHIFLSPFHIATGLPITYALAGMGAFFTAVARVPITAIVIVFEMTTDFNLVLPLMIVSVTSYIVANKVAPGSLYDKLLEWNGIFIEKDAPVDGLLTKLTAQNVMQQRVETLEADMTVEELIQAFSRSHHRGFPVVEENKLLGIITQSDLQKVRERHLPNHTPIREIMTPEPVTIKPKQTLSNVLYLLDRYQISRLPVVDGQRLVGIITRADIIRAEADHLNGETRVDGPQPEPSYVVYQTRSPSIGRGRLLVTLANPDTAETLLQMAATIASDRHYEIECLQIILVSRHSSPSETQVSTTKSRRLLRQAETLTKKWHIPIHTQIRVAHDVAQAVLETIKERHIDLIFMGWKGNTSTPGRIFGTVVDTVIRQASCDVVLVKLGNISDCSHFNRWLVPMAGGPNARAAIKLLPALVTLGNNPQIRLMQVFKSSELKPDMTVLEASTRQLMRHRNLQSTVVASPIQADSVAEGVIDLVKTEGYDVVVLGASREGLLQQAIQGNIPETIASGVESTVILVRGANNL
ncbi:chloride channel protein [Anabaena cylindrica UHCC 0172]|uniref:chloride channel protein n=1 Tax=Anabaena cylindrica TaxID=1165 RepID=UPI002B1F2FBE|nr:chloride channel protein [Anabaena cylindrica]MEA5552815.1 chloride channel protein [Anabaena cylindrica UHCC 0172]